MSPISNEYPETFGASLVKPCPPAPLPPFFNEQVGPSWSLLDTPRGGGGGGGCLELGLFLSDHRLKDKCDGRVNNTWTSAVTGGSTLVLLRRAHSWEIPCLLRTAFTHHFPVGVVLCVCVYIHVLTFSFFAQMSFMKFWRSFYHWFQF